MPALVRFSIFATVLTLGSPTPTCASVVWPNCVLYSYSLLLFLASQLAIAFLPTQGPPLLDKLLLVHIGVKWDRVVFLLGVLARVGPFALL